MSASDVKYHVKVPLNASKTSTPGDNLPTGNRVVTYNSSSGEFDMFPTNPVSLRYKYKGNSNNETPGSGEYKLYSTWSSPSVNTSTDDFASVSTIVIHREVLAFESNSDDGTQLNTEDYLSSFTSGIIEIIADTQNTTDLIFGRFEITSATDDGVYVRFNVTVLASSNISGDEQQAGYEASIIFKGGGGGGNPVVQQARPITPAGTNQYFTLSRIKDGTETVLSASAAFVHKSIGDIEDTQSFELVVETGSLTTSDFGDPLNKNLALATKVPFRLQASESLSPVQSNYEHPYTTPVAATVEHLIVTRSGALNAGQKINFVTINMHPYKGSGSYEAESSGTGKIWENFTYARIEHTATSYDGGKTQQCTYHFTWNKIDNAGDTLPSSLRCTAIENARSPVNGLIVDPSRTTGSFDNGNGLSIDVYHYNVDYAQHIFKYTLV